MCTINTFVTLTRNRGAQTDKRHRGEALILCGILAVSPIAIINRCKIIGVGTDNVVELSTGYYMTKRATTTLSFPARSAVIRQPRSPTGVLFHVIRQMPSRGGLTARKMQGHQRHQTQKYVPESHGVFSAPTVVWTHSFCRERDKRPGQQQENEGGCWGRIPLSIPSGIRFNREHWMDSVNCPTP